jgi:hypothetical protein
VHAFYVRQSLYGAERNHHLYGGAVGVGYYASRHLQGVLRVDLGNHQRHVGIHAECAGVVDHDGAVLGYSVGILQRGGAARRYERHVYTPEVVVMFQLFDYMFFAAESVRRARASLGAEQRQFGDGERVIFEHSEKFLSYGAARAYYGYSHCSMV